MTTKKTDKRVAASKITRIIDEAKQIYQDKGQSSSEVLRFIVQRLRELVK